MHFQANLEGSLCGKTRTGSVCAFSGKSGAEFVRKEKTGGTPQELEREGSKRRNITELVGYKDSGGELVKKVEFETTQGSAPTISVRWPSGPPVTLSRVTGARGTKYWTT